MQLTNLPSGNGIPTPGRPSHCVPGHAGITRSVRKPQLRVPHDGTCKEPLSIHQAARSPMKVLNHLNLARTARHTMDELGLTGMYSFRCRDQQEENASSVRR